MIEKFQWIQERYDELSQAVSQPEIIADTARWQRLLKEHAQLEPAVEAWKRYQALTSQEHQAEEMLSDPELAENPAGAPNSPGKRTAVAAFAPGPQ